MNSAMPPGIGSRIAAAAAVGALVAISTLGAPPTRAFAAQTSISDAADSAISPSKVAYQTTDISVPTSSDGPRRAQLRLSTSYQGDPDDDDDAYIYY
jgi:hypothetical protein